MRALIIGFVGLVALGAAVVALGLWQTFRWAEQPLSGVEAGTGAGAGLVSGAESPTSVADDNADAAAQNSAQSFTVLLKPGENFSSLTRSLARQGVLDRPRMFALYGSLTGLDTQLKSGEYELPVDVSAKALLEQISRGEVVQHSFRIAEGTTVATLLRSLAADSRLTNIAAGWSMEQLADHFQFQLGDTKVTHPEGLFFPETYVFSRGDSDLDLLERAHVALVRQLDDAWAERDEDSPLTNPYDLLILASIIEKETGLPADRGLVSQVFHNRLNKRMLLQTDPTVIYGLGAAFDGNLTREHLRMDSVYNTYRVKGLPPTPIASVSQASLLAAANPLPGNYFYFVARSDGTSQFSETLDEHNAAVRRFQLKQGG